LSLPTVNDLITGKLSSVKAVSGISSSRILLSLLGITNHTYYQLINTLTKRHIYVRTDLSSKGFVKNISILLESALVEQLLTICYNRDISRTLFVFADLSSKASHFLQLKAGTLKEALTKGRGIQLNS
jgi:hypothetical protein